MRYMTCFWLGFILVGLSFIAFDSLLWGFIVLKVQDKHDAVHAISETEEKDEN